MHAKLAPVYDYAYMIRVLGYRGQGALDWDAVTLVRISAAWDQDRYSDATGTCLPAYLAGSANATAANGHKRSIRVTVHCHTQVLRR